MNLSLEELSKEQKHLEQVIEIVKKIIEASDMSIQEKKEEIYEMRKYLWENKLDEIEIAQGRYTVNMETDYTNDKIMQLQKLRKSLENAYFGRIDFSIDDYISPVYIGINGVIDESDFYVFDWRSPIASLFYNYGKGSASYEAPSGEIKGEITLKRQYKVNEKEIERCFDSDLNIDDEYLQEILSSASTEKLKNIVNTIQQDQNVIIRNVTDKVLIVQGIAGSGKTSVALHRVAYLLYKEKNLNSNNVLIFSPNDVFSDYISNVLPELGEENVLQTTFSDFAEFYLKDYKEIESFTEFIEKYYKQTNVDDEQYKIIKTKLSDEFKFYLDNFIKEFENELHFNNSIKINSFEIEAKELDELLKNRFAKLPLVERFDAMSEYICDLINISYKKNGKAIKSKLVDLLNENLYIKNIYAKFLQSNIVSNLSKNISIFDLNAKKIKYEDIAPMMYLMFELNGYPMNNNIKQVIIDEAQDYSSLQIQLLKNIFKKSSFTILGDHNQTINPYYKYLSLREMSDVFENSRFIELNKTYRSSEEIINFTNEILGLDNICSVRKSNEIPVLLKKADNSDLVRQLLEDIEVMKQNGMKRIAIITKNNEETTNLYDVLSDQISDISVIDSSKKNSLYDTIIMPSYISKGLEFDGVIAYTKKDNQYQDRDKFLFYVVCTRAQHSLVVYNQDNILRKIR